MISSGLAGFLRLSAFPCRWMEASVPARSWCAACRRQPRHKNEAQELERAEGRAKTETRKVTKFNGVPASTFRKTTTESCRGKKTKRSLRFPLPACRRRPKQAESRRHRYRLRSCQISLFAHSCHIVNILYSARLAMSVGPVT